MITSFASADSIAKAYTRFVSNFADNAVSAIRLANNIMFSNLDSWKSVMQQAKNNSKHLSNLSINKAKTFEQKSKYLPQHTNARRNNSNVSTGINANTGSGFSPI